MRKNLQLMKRGHARLARPFRGERTELVVAHGNLIRLFVCLSLDLKPTTWLKMRTYNGGISVLLIEGKSRKTLASFNEASHLPLAMRTLS